MAKEKEIKVTTPVVPANNAVRKPTAVKGFDIGSYKESVGASDVPDKPLEWIKISDAIQEITGLPGFPIGYVSEVRGYSNTGKSTALSEAIVASQKAGMLPIIIDTENNIGRDRLTLMGFDWDGAYIMIDNEYLLEKFGKKQNPKRSEAAIEDLGKCMSFFLDQQSSGKLPMDIVFCVDSIGTLNGIQTIDSLEKDDTKNNMWNAGANEKVFMSILNSRIPATRKIDKTYSATVIAVQKIWYDSMNGVIKHKGGETWFFASRLIYHFGGILTHGTKRVTAQSLNREVGYGIEVKMNVNKNQVEGPLGGISMEGKIISTPHGFISPDKIDEYKKKNILYFRKIFGNNEINADQIGTAFRVIGANGKTIFDDLIESSEAQGIETEE